MSLKDTLKQAKRLEKLANQKDENSLSKNNREIDNLNISATKRVIKPRNYLALNPIMQKGGVHDKEDVNIARKQRRRETKQRLRQTDWLGER